MRFCSRIALAQSKAPYVTSGMASLRGFYEALPVQAALVSG